MDHPTHLPAGWQRRAVTAALLPAEIVLLTLPFEPALLDSSVPWTATLLRNSSVLARIGIAVAGTLILVLSPRAGELWARFGQDPRGGVWRWVVLHLLLYLAFFLQTGWLFGGGDGGPADWPIALWAGLAVAVGVSWCAALAPARDWRDFITRERNVVLLSLLGGVGVWLFGLFAQLFWRPLADVTLFFAQGMVRTLYPDAVYDADAGILGTDRLLIEIIPECSGYEGLALVTVFVLVYFWLFRRRLRFPQAFWLLPLGLVAMWMANVVRIASLVVVGTSISPAIATQGFHSQAGWIAFTAVALGIIRVSHRSGLLIQGRPRKRRGPPALGPALLVPFIVMLAASMVAAAFTVKLNFLYPMIVILTAAALWHFRRAYRDPFRVSLSSVGIGTAVFAIWAVLERGGGEADLHAVADLSDLPPVLSAGWIVFRLLGSVVTVPFAEELAFRGYLMRRLVATDFERIPLTHFTWFSFLGSSVLFGLLHQAWLAGTIAGALFALAAYRHGRLADAIVAHMVANALIALSAIAFGWWDLWL